MSLYFWLAAMKGGGGGDENGCGHLFFNNEQCN